MNGFKTYSGIAVALIGLILGVLKVNVTTEEIQPVVNAGLEFAGLAFAAYGRFKAQPKG